MATKIFLNSSLHDVATGVHNKKLHWNSIKIATVKRQSCFCDRQKLGTA